MEKAGKTYFFVIGKVRHGPLPFEALRKLAMDGGLKRNHKIWTNGMPKWEAALTVSGLFDDLPPDLPDLEEDRVDLTNEVESPPPLEPSLSRFTPKPPKWMGFWSFILPGVGQVICGQTVKGAIMIVASIALNLFYGGFLSIVTCPIGCLDAILIAKKRNAGRPVDPWEFFPQPESLTQRQVTIVVGIATVLLLLNILGAFSEQESLRSEWQYRLQDTRY